MKTTFQGTAKQVKWANDIFTAFYNDVTERILPRLSKEDADMIVNVILPAIYTDKLASQIIDYRNEYAGITGNVNADLLSQRISGAVAMGKTKKATGLTTENINDLDLRVANAITSSRVTKLSKSDKFKLAHKRAKEVKAQYPEVNYRAQFSLELRFINAN